MKECAYLKALEWAYDQLGLNPYYSTPTLGQLARIDELTVKKHRELVAKEPAKKN